MIAPASSPTTVTAPLIYRLRGLSTPYKKAKFPLVPIRKFLLIGSHKECDVSIGKLTFFSTPKEQHHIASIHGGLFFGDNSNPNEIEYLDFDAKSILGQGYTTEINGNQLTPRTKYKLHDGDHIKIGDLEFQFEQIRGIGITILKKALVSIRQTPRLLKRVAASILP
ncbi:MAG: FHA domain-containing protein [Candidatus Melainabacteria bacterium]|nr:FHA domain-containing protein [Candidatus Melainabacteria bacterium]MBI3308207.1 FHA domain-containing protein [Candidatus Melainabacteria bacterium]